MTPLPPRAAALRGDDYQHIIGLFHALRVLTDPALESVSVEDAGGGAFDDLVVRPKSPTEPSTYIQVKSGVHNNTVIDDKWLTDKKKPNGKSPLQHFFQTWQTLERTGDPFQLEMFTNKNYDHQNPVLKLIDQSTRAIPEHQLGGLTRRSNGGKQLSRWADHLSASVEELKDFLASVRFRHSEEEQSWIDRCGTLMKVAKLRGDPQAVAVAHSMVREWVKRGAGPRTASQIRSELNGLNLCEASRAALFVVHGIDTVETQERPDVELTLTDLYESNDPFQRRALRDPDGWTTDVAPRLEAARAELVKHGARTVTLVAAMRLPMYFAIGRTLPRVGNWVLTTVQHGVTWTTDAIAVDAHVEVTRDQQIGSGNALAVVVELSTEAATDVTGYLNRSGIPAGHLLALSVPTGPAQDSVPGPSWARDWVRAAREHIRRATREHGSDAVHLFIAAPAGIALFLGHDWNLMPTTTVYEHLGSDGYAAALSVNG